MDLMRKCLKCGKEAAASITTCPKCGRELPPPSAAAPAPTLVVDVNPAAAAAAELAAFGEATQVGGAPVTHDLEDVSLSIESDASGPKGGAAVAAAPPIGAEVFEQAASSDSGGHAGLASTEAATIVDAGEGSLLLVDIDTDAPAAPPPAAGTKGSPPQPLVSNEVFEQAAASDSGGHVGLATHEAATVVDPGEGTVLSVEIDTTPAAAATKPGGPSPTAVASAFLSSMQGKGGDETILEFGKTTPTGDKTTPDEGMTAMEFQLLVEGEGKTSVAAAGAATSARPIAESAVPDAAAGAGAATTAGAGAAAGGGTEAGFLSTSSEPPTWASTARDATPVADAAAGHPSVHSDAVAPHAPVAADAGAPAEGGGFAFAATLVLVLGLVAGGLLAWMGVIPGVPGLSPEAAPDGAGGSAKGPGTDPGGSGVAPGDGNSTTGGAAANDVARKAEEDRKKLAAAAEARKREEEQKREEARKREEAQKKAEAKKIEDALKAEEQADADRRRAADVRGKEFDEALQAALAVAAGGDPVAAHEKLRSLAEAAKKDPALAAHEAHARAALDKLAGEIRTRQERFKSLMDAARAALAKDPAGATKPAREAGEAALTDAERAAAKELSKQAADAVAAAAGAGAAAGADASAANAKADEAFSAALGAADAAVGQGKWSEAAELFTKALGLAKTDAQRGQVEAAVRFVNPMKAAQAAADAGKWREAVEGFAAALAAAGPGPRQDEVKKLGAAAAAHLPPIEVEKLSLEPRPRLGLSLGPAKPATQTAPVTQVAAEGPAARAGLRVGDEVGALGALASALASWKPGQPVDVAVVRGGQTNPVRVTPDPVRELGWLPEGQKEGRLGEGPADWPNDVSEATVVLALRAPGHPFAMPGAGLRLALAGTDGRELAGADVPAPAAGDAATWEASVQVRLPAAAPPAAEVSPVWKVSYQGKALGEAAFGAWLPFPWIACGACDAGHACATCAGTTAAKCVQCAGAGSVAAGDSAPCPTCKGKGLGTPCAPCKGSGQVVCPRCGGKKVLRMIQAGRGQTIPDGCPDCGGKRGQEGTGHVDCPTCKHTGKGPCADCHGTGKVAGTAPCAACKGTGKAPCAACAGSGRCGTCKGGGWVRAK
ncbi:MAG: PDZ domain-containing protein [Planctomycetes bacterium]|nr:PDZ domain-containing protein [Planctomycetota bacterium]